MQQAWLAADVYLLRHASAFDAALGSIPPRTSAQDVEVSQNGSGQDAPASRCPIEHDRLVRRPQ